jgi:fatty-acyl-CoA synthase
MTYGELWSESRALAASLQNMGIEKGDRVAVCLPNWHEFLVMYAAIAHLGAILVPCNTRYRTEEVEYILRNCGAKLAFVTREHSGVNHWEQFTAAQLRVSSLQHLVAVRFEADGLLSYESLLAAGSTASFSPAAIEPKEDVVFILYTSGTTGNPKGAMLTHSNVVHTATMTAECLRCTSDDVFLVAVPVFHVFGMVPSILSAIAAKARMVFMEQYKAGEALDIIQAEKVTIHHGVPTMFILELNHPSFATYDLSSLRTGLIAAAPCPEEIVKRIRGEMGCEIIVAYGLSETSPTLTMTSFDDDDAVRAETVGKPLPGAEVKIVDEQREEVACGEVGELACRSFGVMKGYYNQPEQTKAAIDEEGWFYTGDLARRDEQGNIRIVGRKKEMIIRGGYNIYPREVEEVFYTHPGVLEAAIVGLPDSVLGEVSCAAIRLKPGARETEEMLKEFVKGKVADYKVPDLVLIVDQLPMTASGKIQKIALQQQLQEDLKAMLR